MRKLYLNNDRNNIAYFLAVISTGQVVVETLDGKIKTYEQSEVTMLDLQERDKLTSLNYSIEYKNNFIKDLISSWCRNENNGMSTANDLENLIKSATDIYNKVKENLQ